MIKYIYFLSSKTSYNSMLYCPYSNFKIKISLDIDFLNNSTFFFLHRISLLKILTANF